MEQHHLVKCAGDCAVGALVFVAGLLVNAVGWIDGILPEFMKWGGGVLVAYRLIQAFIIEPHKQNKQQ